MSTQTVLQTRTFATTLGLARPILPAAATSSSLGVARQSWSMDKPSELLAQWEGRYCAGYFEDLARQAPQALLAFLGELRPGYLTLALDSATRHLAAEAYRSDVLPLLEHRSPMVREAAAYALAKEPSVAIRAHLDRLSERDPSEAVREAARSLHAE